MIESWPHTGLFAISTDFFEPLEKVDSIYLVWAAFKKAKGKKVIIRRVR